MLYLLIVGMIVGAIPAIAGGVKGKLGLGLGGFVACMVGEVLLGLLLAIPLCAVFLYLIYKEPKQNAGQEQVIVDQNKNGNTLEDQIKKLSDLKEDGILTEQEFEEKKQQLLEKKMDLLPEEK